MKRYLMALLALSLVLGVVACGDHDDDASGLEKVTLMLDYTPNTNHSGIYLANEKGYYRDAGLYVDIIEPASGGVEQAVAASRAQFGVSFSENVIPARAQSIPIVSVAAIMQHNTSSLFSLTKDNIKRPKDLEGKTYGGFDGPLEAALVKALVACDGGDPSKVKFVNIGAVDFLVGMEQDAFDFAWIFDSWDGVRTKEVEKKAVNTIPFAEHRDCIPDWYTPVLITSEKLIKERPDLVRKFIEATSKGYDEAIANPAAASAALLKGAPETDKALAEASAKFIATRYVDKGRRWGEQDTEIWVKFEAFLRKAGLIEKQVDVKPAFSNDYLPKK